MKKGPNILRTSFAMRLSLGIIALALAVVAVGLGFLLWKSGNYIRQTAIERIALALENTTLRMEEAMNEIVTAADNTYWQVENNLLTDSIWAYSRRTLQLNPDIYGCAIALEPNYFKQSGKYHFIYSLHTDDTIATNQEGNDSYNYFEKDWYRVPKFLNRPCWVDPIYYNNPQGMDAREPIATYSRPLHDNNGQFIGVLANDIKLAWLERVINKTKPYPHAYYFMLGRRGHFYVHPDSTRIFKKTIFSDKHPEHDADLYTLGHQMVNRGKGMLRTEMDGEQCLVFFQPVENTPWSLALVCPENDIMRSHYRLLGLVGSLIAVGFLFLLIFCRRTVSRIVAPLGTLAKTTRHIADHNFSDHMPHSTRTDGIGVLQNSFASMQHALAEYIGQVNEDNRKMEQSNTHLMKANDMVTEADRKKAMFIQNMTHEVRTPLNIIVGFAQVLRDSHHTMPDDELHSIFATMKQNADAITGIIDMLIANSSLYKNTTLELSDTTSCNALLREAESTIQLRRPATVSFRIKSAVDETTSITTNKVALLKVLHELLDNANRFTLEGTITLGCEQDTASTVSFTVTDTGPGIPKAEHSHIFEQFTKLDNFAEGLGLGLTLAKRITAMLGGTLQLDATYTKGARFVVTIPVKGKSKKEKEHQQQK